MIVKVQISQASSDGLVHMLVYNKTREYMYQGEVTKDVLDSMKGKAKAFFKAKLENDPNQEGKKKIILKNEVLEQDW